MIIDDHGHYREPPPSELSPNSRDSSRRTRRGWPHTFTATTSGGRKQIQVVAEIMNGLKNVQHYNFLSDMANRWLSIRVEFLGNFIVFFAAVFAFYLRQLNPHWTPNWAPMKCSSTWCGPHPHIRFQGHPQIFIQIWMVMGQVFPGLLF